MFSSAATRLGVVMTPPKTKPSTCEVMESSLTATIGNKSFQLPAQITETKAALKQQEAKVGNKAQEVNLAIGANIRVLGTDSQEIAQIVETASTYYQTFVNEVDNVSNRIAKKEDVQMRLAAEFNNNVQELLENDPRHAMVRQNSSEFVLSMARAESLLEQGGQGYIETVRKLLSTGENVTVALKDVSFVNRKASLKRQDSQGKGPHSVGSAIANAFCWPARTTMSICHAFGSGYSRVNEDSAGYILKNVTCLLKPGRLTLVLGPPGSSKSSFLKAISGNLLHVPGGAKLLGKIEYNGYDIASLKNLASWVSYVHQTDEHQPLLTTRETLEFAWKCRREPIFSKYPDNEKFKALKQVEVDVMLATLGLTSCKDTYIGDSTLKGVSGGEKRRVTLGEKLVTGTTILALDEISTGLDAAATFDIVAHLSSAAHILGHNIVIALLQPAPEVIDLFDDIICLAEGQIIYHGERAKVLEYFESLGFKIPERMELGDFLQTLPTKSGIKFFQNAGSPAPRTASEFAQIWKASPMAKKEEEEVNAILGKKGASLDNLPQNGFFRSLYLVAAICFRLRLRETAQLLAKLFSNVVMGAFFGSLFWKLGSEESFLKSMLLFEIPAFVFSTAFPNVQVLCKQKPVFLKQLDSGFYSSIAFTFAQFLVSLPFILFDILCFGNIVYWSTGLSDRPETFGIFLLLVFSFAVCVNTTFALCPFLAAKEEASIMISVLFLLVCMLNCGLVATPDIIPPAMSWLYWGNPLSWILRALSINEYHSGGDYDNIPCEFEILGHKLKVNEKCGDYFLEMRQFKTEDYWVWYSLIFVYGFTVVCLLFSFYAVAYIRFEEERSERVTTTVTDEAGDNDVENGGDFSQPLLRRQESISIPRQQLSVRDLWYTVRIGGEDIDFLKGISFFTVPGRMIALMGSSGAGKTTLMDVIAGRKTTGKWRGEILVDGKPKVQSEFIKYAAYVEQFGCHVPTATVLESLQFSAELRLPFSVSRVQKKNFIEEQLELLELADIQNSICAGLSMEQNKRLTLGVELVANPSIVFADEPTSSLDARGAALVMRVLSKIAHSGRTVICTIHQPSTEVFLGFDDLLLLKKGGEIVFFGELGKNARNLIEYFEKAPGTSPCPANTNPGTWMLEILGAGTTGAGQSVDAEGNLVDFALFYKRSLLKRSNDEKFEQILNMPRRPSLLGLTAPAIAKLKEVEETVHLTFVRSYFVQLGMLIVRLFQAYWRTVEFTLARFIVVGIITVLFSVLFWQQELTNVADIQSRVILLFFFSAILSLYNLYTIIPFAMSRLPVFYRERATGMYSVIAHVVADSLVELPFTILEVVFAGGILYATVGMNANLDRALYFLSNTFLIVYLLTMIGLLFAALLPDPLSAQLSAIAFVQILQVFSGVMVPEQNLPHVYKPLYYFSPYQYATEGIVTTQFHGDDTRICAPFGKIATGPIISKLGLCTSDGSNDLSKVCGVVSTVEEFTFTQFLTGFDFSRRWFDVGIVIAWIVAIRLITILAVVYVNHNKR